MRDDMKHVLIDRPRWQSKGKLAKRPLRRKFNDPRGFEDASSRGSAGSVRQYGWQAKEFSDHIAPLFRYVRSQVGRPWDKVYSEVCEHLKATSVTQRHVLEHLRSMVELNPVMGGHNGKVPFYPMRYYGSTDLIPITSRGRWGSFYVAPSGILQQAPKNTTDGQVNPAYAKKMRELGFVEGNYLYWKNDGGLWVRSELRTYEPKKHTFWGYGRRPPHDYRVGVNRHHIDYFKRRGELYPAGCENMFAAGVPEFVSTRERKRLRVENGITP